MCNLLCGFQQHCVRAQGPVRLGLGEGGGAQPARLSALGLLLSTVFTAASPGIGLAQAIDGNLWVTNGPVTAIVQDGGTIYIGGWFTSVGSIPRSHLAQVAADLTVTAWDPQASNGIYAIALSGSTVYIGGNFGTIGGQERGFIAAVDALTGAVTAWDPSANCNVYALAVAGGTGYAGGCFTSIGGQSRNYIAALDGATGTATAWNPNADRNVNALSADGSTLCVGGAFTSMGGQTRGRIAALDTATGVVTAWNPDSGGTVRTIVVNGSTLYAGGRFRHLGGSLQSFITAIEADVSDVPPQPYDHSTTLRLKILPNPFAEMTTITYLLSAESPVTLEVFDPSGRRASTLLSDRHSTKGIHRLEFRRGDLPRGVYLCRLQAGGEVSSRKMLVLE